MTKIKTPKNNPLLSETFLGKEEKEKDEAKENDPEKGRSPVLIAHIGHGRTALVEALMHRLSEEEGMRGVIIVGKEGFPISEEIKKEASSLIFIIKKLEEDLQELYIEKPAKPKIIFYPPVKPQKSKAKVARGWRQKKK